MPGKRFKPPTLYETTAPGSKNLKQKKSCLTHLVKLQAYRYEAVNPFSKAGSDAPTTLHDCAITTANII